MASLSCQHFHWGESTVLEWYRRLDERVGKLVFDIGFLNDGGNRLITVPDHGFCSFGEAKIRTLPEDTEYGKLRGDLHENPFLITVNLDYEIDSPQDVFHAILPSFHPGPNRRTRDLFLNLDV